MSHSLNRDPALRSIQARFDVNNPDLAAFKKTLRKSRPYYLSPCQNDEQCWIVSRFENGRNPFGIEKATLHTVRPVDEDETWLGFFFDENKMSVVEAVEAFKAYVQDAVEQKRVEYRQQLALLDKGMMGFVELGLGD